jgi:hypothetical protein
LLQKWKMELTAYATQAASSLQPPAYRMLVKNGSRVRYTPTRLKAVMRLNAREDKIELTEGLSNGRV